MWTPYLWSTGTGGPLGGGAVGELKPTWTSSGLGACFCRDLCFGGEGGGWRAPMPGRLSSGDGACFCFGGGGAVVVDGR
jgi:hypothetical protein